MVERIAIYGAKELGAYGYHEKPWYLPGARLKAFLAELSASGLTSSVDFVHANPATDAELMSFHTKEHIASMRERCAHDEGSLDQVHPRILRDVVHMLATISELTHDKDEANADTLSEAIAPSLAPEMSTDRYFHYLSSEGLVSIEADGAGLALTQAGQEFLAADAPQLGGPALARAHVERAATWIAGAAIDGTRRILAGEHETVFIPVAGFHHAHPQEARLYCLYNDPALAIQYALAHMDGNIAYVDIDIHQGDGVYEAFAGEPRVHIADLHEDWSTLFPYTPESPGQGEFSGRRELTGVGPGVGTTCNIPLKPNTTDEQYLEIWSEAEAFLRAAKPEFIVFESGVDGLESDPLSHQRLSVEAIYQVTRRVRALADECASGRLLVLGGGSYELEGASKGWAAVVKALLDR